MNESSKLESPKRDYKSLSNIKDETQENSQNRSEMNSNLEMNSYENKNNTTVQQNETEVTFKGSKKKNKVPKRIIHFSDGIVEEFSTDSEEEEEIRKAAAIEEEKKKYALLDPKKLTWVPWVVWYAWFMGSTALSYCDFVGEKLAWWFGITSPKYYYELEEFKRMQEEEKEAEEKRKVDEHGWTNVSSSEVVTTSNSSPNASQQSQQKLEGLNPKQLQQTQSWNSDAKRIIQESRADTELHTVDFDPESQTKHY